MVNEVTTSPTNFIRQIIENDLASGKYSIVRTRFPPEPNGYLHIGHAKSICLNFGIAQDYQGQCNLRFDDTNPEKESIEYIESIKNDIQWLGFQWSGDICYSSNYFDKLYAYAIELINRGLAYVDELSPQDIRKYRGTLTRPGKNSPYRNRSVEDNLSLFEKMRTGGFKENEACLRAKIDMASPFIVMRDPVLYRIKFTKHHQTGNKWCIYPMYDFTHCISDAQEGITHSLCTMEFQVNRRIYDWILNNITTSVHPRQYEFSRLNLEYTVMSKRKLNLLVNGKYVEGWDDPRMPTISGLRRRGYTAGSIREFCKRIGVTKQNSIIEIASLESCIRDDLNKNASRVMVVINPLKIFIKNYPKATSEIITMPNHPSRPEMGNRQVPFSGEIWIDRTDFREEANKKYKRLSLKKEVRLRNAYIIKAEYVEKDKKGNIVAVYCTYDPNTLGKSLSDGRKINGVIHWVSVAHALPVEIRLYNYLFKVRDPDAVDNFLSTINSESLVIKEGYAEPSLQEAKINKSYQFEREGYFCLDSNISSTGRLVFNCTVNLRDTLEKVESKSSDKSAHDVK